MTTRGTTLILLVLTAIQAAMCNVSPDPRTFFPAIEGNLTKIVWAHAVNSQADLERALASDDVMMLEADVVVGKLNSTSTNGTNPDVPIMAHPPAVESDLSLEEFLKNVTEKNSTKGIKLDFKSIEAFDLSKPILEKAKNDLTFPVFINADILPGPVNATNTPVDPKAFLSGAMQVLPESTLSVGWTTRYGADANVTEGRYTSEQIQNMIQILTEEKVKQPITYPVRAGLVVNDVSAIKTLLQNSTAFPNATLTIWSSEGDQVDATRLSKFIVDVGFDKVYLDVPSDLMQKLNFNGASTIGATLLFSLAPMIVSLLMSKML